MGSPFVKHLVNSLPNGKFEDQSKFKTFADNKIISTQKSKSVFGRVENIVGKGQNAGYLHFLLFPQYFQKFPFPGVLKVVMVKGQQAQLWNEHR